MRAPWGPRRPGGRGPRRAGSCRRSYPPCGEHNSRIEAVARAAHGDEVARFLGVRLEALAELPDEVVDGTDAPDRLAPHQLEQLVAREHLVRVPHEEHEQLQLGVRQLDLDARARDDAL